MVYSKLGVIKMREGGKRRMKIIYQLLIGLAFIGLIMLMVSEIVYSDEAKERRMLKDNFESCMGDIAEEYCINQSMEYSSVDFYGTIYEKDFPSISDTPYRFRCNSKRTYNEWTYFKFTKEEIDSCVDKFVNVSNDVKQEVSD